MVVCCAIAVMRSVSFSDSQEGPNLYVVFLLGQSTFMLHAYVNGCKHDPSIVGVRQFNDRRVR